MVKKVLLKDILFNKTKIEQIACEIHRVYPSFKGDDFVRGVLAKFPALELKARISWIAEYLRKYLPSEYRRAISILLKALPPPNRSDLSDDDFGDFIYAPYAEYAAKNGCSKEHLRLSLSALYEITQRFSVEDAVRFFLNAFPEETLRELLKWSKDPHYHVRRLASEGTRPKLPWSQKINIPVTAPLAILDNLFSDKTRFVTRSVANHVNDISKLDPDLAMDTLAKWKKSGKQEPEEMDYIVRHALRTLVKQGHPEALQMLGFSHAPQVTVTRFIVPEAVKMDTSLDFSFTLIAKEKTNVLVDYILYFQNKSGKLNGKKIFKLKKIALEKNRPITISKGHLLRERMTTRTLYPGRHEVEIQVNGRKLARRVFVLK